MSVRDTPFARDATTGKRVTPWWLTYILVLIVFILGLPGILGAIFQQTWKVGAGTPEAQLQEALTFGVGFVGLVLWVWLYERRGIASLGFRRPGRGVLTLLAGMVIGIVLNTVPTLFLWGVGAYERVSPPDGSTSGLAAMPMLLLILFFFALLVTFVALRQGALWIAIGIHTGWNFAMGNLYGIPVSGLPAHTTSAIFLAPTGGAPDGLTGGEFGTEASVPEDVLLAVAALIAFLIYRARDRRRSPSPVIPAA